MPARVNNNCVLGPPVPHWL